ncbi:patatin-like phospholipase family protein [Mesorhizobium sp. CGMCC 1.15528]|uniref:Patatin-like phospholipase family protein n=1 Tax=Mesorhizobium zhangyense TaxID=1776730 RepID=A0A7C9RBJ9_9HYPH|nr:patatin-like phospholipase family protein [Mesorhizobium zhangyense]NGN44934.1 patatin-like phospholipase family protein [Mesorhizobium zhangyense]
MDQTVKKRRGETPDIQDLIAPYQSVALVLQGGGALGAYQAGVFQALSEAGISANWLSGVSIGAINAAIIAGNEPGNQVDRLRDFWETVSGRKVWHFTPEGDAFRKLRNQASAMMTMMSGLPGFFKLRELSPWYQLPGATGATSFYDTGELEATLNRLIDWNVLNDRQRRLSVGAVNVRTGNFRYFDSEIEIIGPQHIMASGALPPAFPAIHIENEYYWDGGIVSNTPLQYLLEQEDVHDTLVFQVDLFSARGILPRDMGEVQARHKDIMYSSRTRNNTDTFRRLHNVRLKLHQALLRIPPEILTEGDKEFLASMEDVPQINIVHLIYQPKIYESDAKDYEFSGTSMREHWDAGYQDTRKTLRHRKWLVKPPESIGMTVHDIHRDDPS